MFWSISSQGLFFGIIFLSYISLNYKIIDVSGVWLTADNKKTFS